jgi:hypothetical protein
MSYELTKEQLKQSAYYCAAGIDIQPIVRFGDIVNDFIYVTLDVSKTELINGLKASISKANTSLQKENASLELISYVDFEIDQIEHEKQNRLIFDKPDYFSEEEFKTYSKSISPFYERNDDYFLVFDLRLTIGHLERNIRLFHITGEALATYDVIFRNQGIAPLIFISIQTGLIEIPERFSNKMFELSLSKPKIWLRGVWISKEKEFRVLHPEIFNDEVFSTQGIYNENIGEYRGWEVEPLKEINSSYDESKTIRIVKAYGMKSEWQDVGDVQLSSKGLIINKKLDKYNGNMSRDYQINKLHFPLSNLQELTREIEAFSKLQPAIKEIRVAIFPAGFESFELMLNDFYVNYTEQSAYNLIIDIFYANKSDLKRDF